MKQKTIRFLNELHFRDVQRMMEEKIPKGFFTTKELAKKINKSRRTTNTLINNLIEEGKIEVRFFRAKLSPITIRKTVFYRYKK